MCNTHYFYGQLAIHFGRKFYKTVTTLYSLGFLELLLQTILGRGTSTLKYSNSVSGKGSSCWHCPFSSHKSHYCGEKNSVTSQLSLSSTGSQFQCSRAKPKMSKIFLSSTYFLVNQISHYACLRQGKFLLKRGDGGQVTEGANKYR